MIKRLLFLVFQCGWVLSAFSNCEAVQQPLNIGIVIHTIEHQSIVYHDSTIQHQIQQLNDAFNGVFNHQVEETFQNNIGHLPIRFYLAQRQHVFSGHGVFFNNDIFYTNRGGSNALKPQEYINIWVADLPEGIEGYSTKLNQSQFGVVVDYQAFGTSELNLSNRNLGRTLVHEIAHFFNVPHIYTGESCRDDEINDTPLQKSMIFQHPDFEAQCEGPVMSQNFMNAAPDEHRHFFSEGQVQLMKEFLCSNTAFIQSDITHQSDLKAVTHAVKCVHQKCQSNFDLSNYQLTVLSTNARQINIELSNPNQFNLPNHLTSGFYWINGINPINQSHFSQKIAILP